tara:strand:- start:178 stop:1131 length:954 start_codon:yes stop_codon:yes gene_type:complete
MVHVKDNGKINFILYCHYHFGEVLTGGILAMHYLAFQLAKKGYNVYMFTEPYYDNENLHSIKSWRVGRWLEDGAISGEGEAQQWEQFTYPINKTVVVYDQDAYHNALGINNVARWMLHTPQSHIMETWGESDSIFTYGDQETLKDGIQKVEGNLIAMDFHLDTFKNRNLKERKGVCHLFHKHTSPNAKTFINELNSTDLGSWKAKGCWEYMAEQFSKHEYFITYDQLSFWPQVAALCGCKSIVMNPPKHDKSCYDPSTTPEQYRAENPLKKYGVAFGFNDLQWAIDTQHLVGPHLEEMDKKNKETIDNFALFWENKL